MELLDSLPTLLSTAMEVGLESKMPIPTITLSCYLSIFQLKEISEIKSVVFTRPGSYLLRQVDTDSTCLVISNVECG